MRKGLRGRHTREVNVVSQMVHQPRAGQGREEAEPLPVTHLLYLYVLNTHARTRQHYYIVHKTAPPQTPRYIPKPSPYLGHHLASQTTQFLVGMYGVSGKGRGHHATPTDATPPTPRQRALCVPPNDGPSSRLLADVARSDAYDLARVDEALKITPTYTCTHSSRYCSWTMPRAHLVY